MKEGCNVVLHSEQLGDSKPLSCDDLYEQFVKARKDVEDPQGPPLPPMDQTLTRCSQSDVCTFFLGVGVAPLRGEQSTPKYDEHAVRFFNEKLLPSLYEPGATIPPGQRLAQVKVSPCDTSSGAMTGAGLFPAVQRLPFPQGRFIPVASTENCTAPGVTGTAGKTLGG